MCGLATIVSPRSQPLAGEHLAKIGDLLSHRGPDKTVAELVDLEGCGIQLGLVHCRLSIIDLSASADQPFRSHDRRWLVVFNGEIYNYLELRAELVQLGCQFESDSDTEVLLWAWRVWGERSLGRLRGMFAFVVVDLFEGTLSAVTDPFGIKPLYFTRSKGRICFASEIRPLLALSNQRAEVNNKVVYDYLEFGSYDQTEQTFFEGIASLGPGMIAALDFTDRRLKLSTRSWMSRPTSTSLDVSWSDAQQRVLEELRQSVKIHLRADVGLGVALSGGLDSSALTALVKDIEPDSDVDTFSFVVPGHSSDESFWSNRVAEHLRTTQHLVSPSARQVGQDIDDVVRYQGEPFGSLSIYAQYAVYREARAAGLTVVIDGQGGDEVFGGYKGYPEFRLRSLLADGDLRGALEFLSGWRSFPRHSSRMAILRLLGTYLPQSLQSLGVKLVGKESPPPWIRVGVLENLGVPTNRPAVYGYPLRDGQDNRQLVKRLSEALFSGEMVNLLRHGDRNSMRWSIESRVPFLNVDVVNLALSLPEEFLVSNNGLTKNVLRHAMRGLLPDDVLFRRDKVGFEAPDMQWLKQMAKNPKDLVDGLSSIPWIGMSGVVRYLDSIWDGSKPYSNQAWRLINLSKWNQQNS